MSRELLREAARTRYFVPTERVEAQDSVTLPEAYGIDAPTEEARVRAAAARLAQSVKVTVDGRTGLISLRTTAESPELAVQLNRKLLELLNRFNLETRQSAASAERRFVEARLAEARAQLARAEAAMEDFLQRNRGYGQSPQLAFDAARLERQVQFRQQLYTGLALAYEQARIDEVRDLPMITLLEGPEGSESRVGTPLFFYLLLALTAGVVVAGVIVLIRLYFDEHPTDSPEYREFRALRQGLFRFSGRRTTRKPQPATGSARE